MISLAWLGLYWESRIVYSLITCFDDHKVEDVETWIFEMVTAFQHPCLTRTGCMRTCRTSRPA